MIFLTCLVTHNVKVSFVYQLHLPIPVAGRSKAWVYDCSVAKIGFRIPPATEMSASCACRMLSGLHVELITRPECDRVASIMGSLAS
jgi:hypothetical protein